MSATTRVLLFLVLVLSFVLLDLHVNASKLDKFHKRCKKSCARERHATETYKQCSWNCLKKSLDSLFNQEEINSDAEPYNRPKDSACWPKDTFCFGQTCVCVDSNDSTGNNRWQSNQRQKSPVNLDLFPKFNISVIASQLEKVILAMFNSNSMRLEKNVTIHLGGFVEDNLYDFSNHFLGVFNRSLNLREAYISFLSSLDMPDNFQESVENNVDLVRLKKMIQEMKQNLFSKEQECQKNYEKHQHEYSFAKYKDMLCPSLKEMERNINALLGQLYTKDMQLKGKWATLLDALKIYDQATLDGKVGLWSIYPSIKSLEQTAVKSTGPSFSIKLGRSNSIHLDSLMENVVIDYLLLKKNITKVKENSYEVNGTVITEMIEVNETISYRVPNNATLFQNSTFLVSNTNSSKFYAFSKANTTFSIEYGAKAHSVINVRPRNDWFHEKVFKEYRNGPFKPTISPDYFFGPKGILHSYLKTLVFVVDPYIVITADRGVKEFIQNNERITLFNIPFDMSPITGDTVLTITPSDKLDDLFIIRLEKKETGPLLLAADMVYL
jgi:hypothetical protein